MKTSINIINQGTKKKIKLNNIYTYDSFTIIQSNEL